jgi:PEP-CTERM motif
MKKQLATLVGSSLVIASALSFSTLDAYAKGGKPSNDSAGETTSLLCDAAGAGVAGFTSCLGPFDMKVTGNDVLGNGSGPLFDMLSKGAFGGITDWTFGGKQDAGASGATGGEGEELGFQWKETSEGQGTWSLAKATENLYADIVISLKTATSWSAYYIQKGTALSDFQNKLWNTLGVDLAGNGNNGKALSHASLFYANLEDRTPVVEEEPPIVDENPPIVEEEPPIVDENPPIVDENPPVVEEEPPVIELPPVENLPPLYQPPMEGVEIPDNNDQPEAVDIPEPSMMLGLGVVGALVGVRRRKSGNNQ